MKRDMELIRKMLLELEGEAPVDLSQYSKEQQTYHTVLLLESGLITSINGSLDRIARDGRGNPIGFPPLRLTWAGHEFLDAAKNDTIWNQTRNLIKTKAGDVSFEVLKTVLTECAKRAMGL